MEAQVYTASDIQELLALGRTKTYEFLNEVSQQQEPLFKVIRVGASIRVLKHSFDNWLNAGKN